MATRRFYSDQQLCDLARQSIDDANLTRSEVADQFEVSRAAVSQALNPTNPSFHSMKSLRIRIVEELGGVDVERGYLVRKAAV